ncbi:MAG: GNAT family N-acetyltransferase, partial [Lachnospiraceae bacterium]|nr:GNAT family N-acetyltransferase [Lachnospiraceae bacterium]
VHEEWYFGSLNRADRRLYLCRHMDKPVGMFRLDFLSGTEAEISYSIDKAVRHRGYGREMIREGERLTAAQFPGIKVLYAKVKPENAASCRIFEELGYEKEETDTCVRYRKGMTS